jgi:hypothetical protein
LDYKRSKNPNTVDRYIGGFELKHKVADWISLLGRLGLDGYSDKRITDFPYELSRKCDGRASEALLISNRLMSI